jgi:hypothetical protein
VLVLKCILHSILEDLSITCCSVFCITVHPSHISDTVLIFLQSYSNVKTWCFVGMLLNVGCRLINVSFVMLALPYCTVLFRMVNSFFSHIVSYGFVATSLHCLSIDLIL